jgi:hypothetical protein
VKGFCSIRWLLLFCAFIPSVTFSQARKPRELKKGFQFSLFPGISTNGISSGSYINKFSLNLFGGLSAGNRIFEAGLVTNINLDSVTGIQIAGLANIVGANTFLNLTVSEERELQHAGFESNSHGIQAAGFLNYVRNNTKGIQIAGAFNIVGFDFNGFQLAGIGNSAGSYAQGFQIAGLYNIADEGIGGVQVSMLHNSTRGQLAGTQLSLINRAVQIKGQNSSPPDASRGLQIGMLNFSKDMAGTQIGLINFGGTMRGRQIGLINFFDKSPPKDNVKNGLPIGLLNFGSMGSYFRISFNELFPLNAEYSTGNCANCSAVLITQMPYDENWKKYNQNALMIGYNPTEESWGFGYGFQRLLFNKFSMVPTRANMLRNEKKMIGYGVKFIHLNRNLNFDKVFNLVSRFNLDYGIRVGGISGPHLVAGVALNYFLQQADEPRDVYKIQSARLSLGKIFSLNTSIWPGYSVGLHF